VTTSRWLRPDKHASINHRAPEVGRFRLECGNPILSRNGPFHVCPSRLDGLSNDDLAAAQVVILSRTQV
jgi:hypothetical protein